VKVLFSLTIFVLFIFDLP